MSQAYRCDLCGDCVDNADDAKAEREVAREASTVSGTVADLYIKIGVDMPHTCDTCFAIVMQKAKAWMNANIP
jgi:hypothetical protein